MTGSDIGAIMTGIAAIIAAVIKMKGALPLPLPPKGLKQWFFTILPIILGACAVALVVVPRIIPSPLLSIKITSPEDGAVVSQEIMVEGYTTKELPEDQYLYIAVQWMGLWWPQYSNVAPVYSQMNKNWEFSTPATVGKEDDAGGEFTIVAVLVDTDIHHNFQSWFKQVEKQGWTGIHMTQLSDWGEEKKIYHSITIIRQ